MKTTNDVPAIKIKILECWTSAENDIFLILNEANVSIFSTKFFVTEKEIFFFRVRFIK
jgi:hypothetical protein